MFAVESDRLVLHANVRFQYCTSENLRVSTKIDKLISRFNRDWVYKRLGTKLVNGGLRIGAKVGFPFFWQNRPINTIRES